MTAGPRRGWLVAAVVLVVVAAGCGKPRQRRDRDAGAPVEIVPRPGSASIPTPTSIDEIEPNDGDDVATALALGGTARGRIEPAADLDLYRIEVTEPGVLALALSAVEGLDGTLELQDPSGAVLARSDRPGARVAEGLPNVGVTPGRYVAIVRGKRVTTPAKKKGASKDDAKAAAATGSAQGPAPVYELSVRLQPIATGAEREPNDDRGTAADLIPGDTVTGYVGWTGDADVWKLSVEALSDKNAIDVEVSAIDGSALALEVANGIGQVVLVRKVPRGHSLVARGLVPVVAPGASPFTYLTIRADRSNPELAYQMKIAAKLIATDAEIEPNDGPDTAMRMPADRTVVHGHWAPGDVDCYVLAADPAARTLEIVVDTPAESDLSLELLVDGRPVSKSELKGKGVLEKVSGTVPAGAQPVVRVRGIDSTAEGSYDLQVAEGPSPITVP